MTKVFKLRLAQAGISFCLSGDVGVVEPGVNLGVLASWSPSS